MGTLHEVSNAGIVDFKRKGTTGLVLEQGTSDPGDASDEGQIFYRTDTDELKISDGVSFNALSVAIGGGWQDNGGNITLVSNTDQVRIGDGSVSAPSLGFENDVNTGLFATDNGTAATGTYTVVDYTQLGSATVTVDGNVLTEGVEWTAASSNDATATSLASAIDGLGTVDASAATNAVTVTASSTGTAGNSIATLTSDAVNLTVSGATLSGGVDRADGLSLVTGGVEALQLNTSQQLVVPKTSSQIILGTTNTTTITSTAPSSSRIVTIPDAGGNSSFVLTAGTQTIGGDKTFSGDILLATGAVGSPSLTFSGDTNTGLYQASSGSDILDIALGGVKRWSFTNPKTFATFASDADVSAGLRLTNSGTGKATFDVTSDANQGTFAALGSGATGNYWTSGPALADSVVLQNGGGANLLITTDSQDTYFYSSAASARWRFFNTTNNERAAIGSEGIRVTTGSVSLPSFSFLGDTNTGLYQASSGSDILDMALGGVQRWIFAHPLTQFAGSTVGDAASLKLRVTNSGTGKSVIDAVSDTSQIILSAMGSGVSGNFWSGGPAIADSTFLQNAGGATFVITTNTQDTHFYSSVASARWRFFNTTNNERASIGSQGIQVGTGSVSLPAFSFLTDPDSGMYRSGSDIISFAVGGSERCSIANASPYFRFDAPTGTGSQTATLTNSLKVGNPTTWFTVKINGTDYLIPAWAA